MNPIRLLIAAAMLSSAAAAQFDVFFLVGEKLRGNPLGDPLGRHVAVFSPDNTAPERPLPLVIYLPGWGGSAEDVIKPGENAWCAAVIDELVRRELPVRLAVIDGRSRYGGSQYLNSAATGNYADYVTDDIVPAVEARYALAKEGAAKRIIAGHSSGGYGALMFALRRHDLFDAVVALSPDCDFNVTHKPFTEQPSVRALKRADLDGAFAGKFPTDGLARLMLGLSANYTPTEPGRFEWVYDDNGNWQADVWQRWLELDPLTLVRRRDDAFAPTQRVYLDGAEKDEFGANIGARKIQEELASRESPSIFFEAPGQHSDHIAARLIRGLAWALGKPLPPIK
jgi:S-formylglutathione hydrolase FrmB